MNIIKFSSKVLLWLMPLMLIISCSTLQKSSAPLTLKGSIIPLQPGDIVDTRTGKSVSFDTLLADLLNVQVIYVGEVHTSMEDHQIQLQVANGLYARNPHMILAMEMFPRDVQPLLDQYSQGLITDQTLLEDSNWNDVWGYPFQFYQNLFKWAQDRHVRLLGLNAPPTVVRKVGQQGISSLTPDERSQIAKYIDLSDADHRAYVKQEYDQHLKGDIRNFESFYEAQLTWEETMAETLAEALATMENQGQILVLMGNGHIIQGFGVPQRTQSRVQHRFKTIVPIPVDYPGRVVNPDFADYIWITKESTAFHHRWRLGIMLKPSPGQGLEVMGVVPNSPAAKAGILKGDILHNLDGMPVNTVEDIHQAVSQKQEPVHQVILKRGAQEIKLELTLTPDE